MRNRKSHPSHGLSRQNTCGNVGHWKSQGSLPGLLRPLIRGHQLSEGLTQMTRTLHKPTLQQHHTPALQTSACKSGSAHLGATNTGSQAGLDPFADPVLHALSCRQNPLTSKAAEPSFFVVFADVGLVVPPHRGPQVLRSTDGSFSERGGEGSGRLRSCSGEGPWGPGQNQTPDSLDRKKLAATAKFKPRTGAFVEGA